MKNQCWLIEPTLEVSVVYVHVPGCPVHLENGRRFVDTWLKCPPGFPAKLIVIANGGKPNGQTHELFGPLNPSYFEHDDSGWDIGAYQHYCQDAKEDMTVFFGGSTYFRRPNWLRRMVDVFLFHGSGLFGSCGNMGDLARVVAPHIRTTGFWCSPKLIDVYPFKVTHPSQRYPFEHGHHGLTSWMMANGVPVRVADFSGCYEYPQWDLGPQGYHRGQQKDLLVGDRMTREPFYLHP